MITLAHHNRSRHNKSTVKKLKCPSCGEKSFVPYVWQSNDNTHHESGKKELCLYVDTDTQQQYGKCDRADNCNTHIKPEKSFFKALYDNKKMDTDIYTKYDVQPTKTGIKHEQTQKKARVYLPDWLMEKTLKNYENNSLVQYLCATFTDDFDGVVEIMKRYRIGTTNTGDCIYWFSDKNGVNSGQIKYIESDGHARKHPNGSKIHRWVHTEPMFEKIVGKELKQAYSENENYITACYFGSHLIKQFDKILFVEAPATAIVCEVIKQIIVGNLEGKLTPETIKTAEKLNLHTFDLFVGAIGLDFINDERSQVFENCNVSLIPDCSKKVKIGNNTDERGTLETAYYVWLNKLHFIEKYANNVVLKDVSTWFTDVERAEGFDLKDVFTTSQLPTPQTISETITAEVFTIYTETDPDGQILDDTETVQYNAISETFNTVVEYDSEADPMPVWNTEPEPTEKITADWTAELDEIELFFKTAFPKAPVIFVDAATQVLDVPTFVENHLRIARQHNGRKYFEPYLNRLRQVKKQYVQSSVNF